jgi:PAS domain S-box-containing protein
MAGSRIATSAIPTHLAQRLNGSAETGDGVTERTRRSWTETDRLAALAAYDILDTAREPAFDGIALLLAQIFDAPIALVNLIDSDRAWFKAEVGTGMTGGTIETSFCAVNIREGEGDVMVVADATRDPRFANNPFVSGEPGLRFYAGRLLKTPEGIPLGALCVHDLKPRSATLTPIQASALEVLAGQVMDQMELRRSLRAGALELTVRQAVETELAATIEALAESEQKFRVITESMPEMVWSTLPDGFHDYYNARWYEFTGVADGSTDGEGWAGMFHADDQDRARALWQHCLATGEPYEIEYRLRHATGAYRWVLGRARPIRDTSGRIVRWFGTCTDIDELKRLQDGKDLLSQELSHRIKNIFAVVSALIALSAWEFPEAQPFAKAVRDRVAALARAHEFVRPHTEASRPSVGSMTLHAFLDALFRPYTDDAGRSRIILLGDDAVFDDQAATSAALLFHELATNAAKYGALSLPGGRVQLTTQSVGDRFVLTWDERDGPGIEGPPTRTGFGSSLATVSVEGQLGGRLERSWRPGGLLVVADLPATALSRRRAALKTI